MAFGGGPRWSDVQWLSTIYCTNNCFFLPGRRFSDELFFLRSRNQLFLIFLETATSSWYFLAMTGHSTCGGSPCYIASWQLVVPTHGNCEIGIALASQVRTSQTLHPARQELSWVIRQVWRPILCFVSPSLQVSVGPILRLLLRTAKCKRLVPPAVPCVHWVIICLICLVCCRSWYFDNKSLSFMNYAWSQLNVILAWNRMNEKNLRRKCFFCKANMYKMKNMA